MNCLRNLLAVCLFLLCTQAPAQTADLQYLVGWRVTVQHATLYKPGTAQPLAGAYAGQLATIVEVVPSTGGAAYTLLFDDGTRADTGSTPLTNDAFDTCFKILHGDSRNISAQPPISYTTTPDGRIVGNLVPPPPPQPGDLTDAQVAAALARGYAGKRHKVGVSLTDYETRFLSGFDCKTCGSTGFTITVYNPEQWLEEIAMEARENKEAGRIYTPADIGPDLRHPLLRVFALPSYADRLSERGIAGSSSAQQVVLNNTQNTESVQPIALQNGETETHNDFRSVTYQTATATFLMSDVDRLRAENKDKEFVIQVIGDAQTKLFRLKARHLNALFGKDK